MSNSLSFKIYEYIDQLPAEWDEVSSENLFLTTEYLRVLELSAPENMTCHYIGLFDQHRLCGVALSQFLDLNNLTSFGERERCFKTLVRNFIFRNFSSHVLFIGNNMLTGQNAYSFTNTISRADGLGALLKASQDLKLIFRKKGYKTHLTTFKDFTADELPDFQKAGFGSFYRFTIQPNMIFDVPPTWDTFDDYLQCLTKKYRDQYKRSQKRSAAVIRQKMNLQDIEKLQDEIYDLYVHVARNAPFNTFFLARNHFYTLKQVLKDKFLFYGYFDGEKLIGFNTLIKNGDTLDTYFLGYDDRVQREKMLYLNMLYDMVGYAIKKKYKKIVFARTALEIKSSVGATPVEMYGFLAHENRIVNTKIDRLFNYLEPKPVWQQRSPFRV